MSIRQKKRVRVLQRNRRVAAFIAVLAIVFTTAFCMNRPAAVQAQRQAYKYYTDVKVERKMTLSDIADQYMSEEYESREAYIREVKELNNIGNTLELGQKLVVPYYSEVLK